MKPIIHFSHANGFPASCYKTLFSYLDDQYDVRSIDCLGHQTNFPVSNNWTHLEAELTHYFERHYRQPVIAIGHSLGGVLSFLVAMKRPDLVRALIMLDSPVLTPFQSYGFRLVKRLGLSDRFTPAGRTDGRRREWDSIEEAQAYFSEKSLMKNFDPRCLADYVEHGTIEQEGKRILKFDPDTEMSIYRTIPDNIFVKQALKVPSMIMAGNGSAVFRRSNGQYMKSVAGMELKWLDGSHMYPFEWPQQTADAIHQQLKHWGVHRSLHA